MGARAGPKGTRKETDQGSGFVLEHSGGTAERGATTRCGFSQSHIGLQAGRSARSRFLSARSKNRWRRCVPQQARRLLERRCCRQLNRIPAAVVEPALNDGGDGCGDDRLAEGHCACGNGVRPSATLAALDQGCDVVTPIQAAARIGRIGLHADLTAAHIRIKSWGRTRSA